MRPTVAGGEGHVNVAEQPGCQASLFQVSCRHREVAISGIQAEPIDIAMSDSDAEGNWIVVGLVNPACGWFPTGFGGTGARKKLNRLTIHVVSHDRRLIEQFNRASGRSRFAKPLPDLSVGAAAKVMIARQDQHGCPGEARQNGGSPLDISPLHSG